MNGALGVLLPAHCWVNGKLRPPPWNIHGTTLSVTRCDRTKTVEITIPEGCMGSMTDEQIVLLLQTIGELEASFRRTLPPGWTVKA